MIPQNDVSTETAHRQMFHVKHLLPPLFADAEPAEYLAQQVICGKFAGNSA